MTTYEREQQQIDEAILKFPGEFRLRAYPAYRFRLSDRLRHFVDHNGDVQLVVDAMQPNGEWLNFSRGTVAEIAREVRK